MKINYLGTAASEGWPAIFCNCDYCNTARKLRGKNLRTRSQAIIDKSLLIDFPPDSYSHALYGNIPFTNIRDLLITHTHFDHFFPTDLMLQLPPYAHERKEILHVYGNEKAFLRLKIMANSLYGSDNISNIIDYHIIKTGDVFKTSTGYKVTALKADHGRKDQEFFIYLIENNGKKLLYAHDTGWFPEETWTKLLGNKIDFLSIDGTNGPLEGQNGHLGVPAILNLLDVMRKNQIISEGTKVVMSHFSHNGGLLQKELEELVKPYGIAVAYDGYTLEF